VLVLAAAGVSAAGCSVEVKPPRDTSKDIKIEGPNGGGIDIKRGGN
jgi:hypothetical protein